MWFQKVTKYIKYVKGHLRNVVLQFLWKNKDISAYHIAILIVAVPWSLFSWCYEHKFIKDHLMNILLKSQCIWHRFPMRRLSGQSDRCWQTYYIEMPGRMVLSCSLKGNFNLHSLTETSISKFSDLKKLIFARSKTFHKVDNTQNTIQGF